MKKRVLFVMSDTGGGHRAAARAIEEALHYLYPDSYETMIEDIWAGYMPWPINQIPRGYPWLTGAGLPLWQGLWASSTHFQPHHGLLPILSPLLGHRIIPYLQHVQPDLVISVHPLMNHLVSRWLKKSGLNIPLVTVVTDMVTIHPLWVCPDVTRCLVPTEAARRSVLDFGMPAEKVEVCGQPISLKFSRPGEDKPTLRRKLKLAPDRPTVLVMSGGEGFGKVFEITQALAGALPQAQLLVVTGRNKVLKAHLAAGSWEIPTYIYGFVDNIVELMGASDLLVTKAGPGTLSEAFSMGLPVLLYGYIPGQERGNVDYVQENGAGAYVESPEALAALVAEWLTPGNPALPEMARQAARLARPQAALAIATQLDAVVREGVKTQPDLFKPRSRWQNFRAARLALRVLRL